MRLEVWKWEKREHLSFSVLDILKGKSFFKVARHIYTNQLGFLCLPTQVGALGWVLQQVNLGTHIITHLGTSTLLMWQWGVVWPLIPQ